MGVYPSGQRGQTVNLLSVTTVVRTHPLPPKNGKHHKVFAVFFRMNFAVAFALVHMSSSVPLRIFVQKPLFAQNLYNQSSVTEF